MTITPLRLFNLETEQKIIREGFSLLEDPGVMVHNIEVLDLLEESGAVVDKKSQLARIPEKLSRKALKSCPAEFSLYNLLGDPSIIFGSGYSYFTPGSSALTMLDRNTQKIRPGKTEDLVSFSKLTEMLKQLDAQSTAIVCSDVPQEIADLYRLYLVLCYSSKPIVTGAFRKDTLKVMIDLLTIASGSKEGLLNKPRAIFDICPTSPLKWGETSSQNLIDCARYGIPVQIVPMPLAGATSPVTLAGTIVQHTAECLSGIVISQITSKGSPVVWGGSPAIFDMKSSTAPLGAAGSWLLGIGYAQIGRALGLPTGIFMGISDAKSLDSQAGLESSSSSILAAFAGINLISGAGMLALENCQSLEKLVIDAEIISISRYLTRGVLVRDEPIALDLIRDVGHQSDFLSHEHTLQWFKEESYFPSQVIDRKSPADWENAGSLSSREHAYQQVDQLLSLYPGPSLGISARKELEKITRLAAKTAGMDHLPVLRG